ncbi:MAG: hypothetical protein K8T90_09260 [Planctomycetes bacterium]|nr:hypothetical protein [Planctomycetota bacterium]
MRSVPARRPTARREVRNFTPSPARPAALGGINVVLARVGAAAGIAGLHPHGLRHTAITTALDATSGDVRRVQRFSRHRDARVLQRYDDARDDGAVAALVAEMAK